MPAKKQKNKKASKAKVVAMQQEEEVIDEKQTPLQQAAAAEKKDDLELAEKIYNKQIQLKSFNAAVYKRLMIIYRKQKRYKDELDLINKGLKHFDEYRKKQSSKKNINTNIKRISQRLNKSLGLTNSRGKELYEPAPIPEWKKRKATVEKRLKKKVSDLLRYH